MGWKPKAPDMTQANQAAADQAQIAREQWADYRDNFAPVILDQMQQQIDIGDKQFRLADEAQRFNLGLARKYDDRFWSRQAPLEDSIIDDANSYDTEAERARMAGMARGDVEQAFGDSMSQMNRDFGRRSIDPNSPASIMMRGRMGTDRALASAAAMTKTREAARQMGWSKKMDAAALSRGLPGFTSGASQMALGWNGAGLNAGGTGLAAATGASGASDRAAQVAGGLYGSASNNFRTNAIEGAKNPGFDALMGLASGGLKLAGTIYGKPPI